MRPARIEAPALCLVAALAAGAAMGQPAGDPAPDAAGIRAGSVIFAPSASLSAGYDDNIFRTERAEKGSGVIRLGAALAAETDWRRHALAVEADVEAGLYTSSSDDDYVDAGLAAEGILDATRAARLRLRAGLVRGHEARGADDDAPAALSGPIRLLRLFGDLTGQYAPGRLRLQPFIGAERVNYDDIRFRDGRPSDQDRRDRTRLSGGARAGFRPPGRLEYFAEASVAVTDYDKAVNAGGFDRDNTAYRASIGFEAAPTGPLSGGVSLGYLNRRNQDPGLADFDAVTAEAALEWRPSRLVEIALLARRGVEETTVARASAVTVTFAQVTVDYEVRRFLDLALEAAYERQAFDGIARRDDNWLVGAGFDWRLRRDATLRARVRHLDENSNAPGESSASTQVFLDAEYRF